MVDLVEEMSEVMHNMLEMVEIVVKSIHDCSCRCHIKEFVYWGLHDGFQGLLVYKYYGVVDDENNKVLSDAVD